MTNYTIPFAEHTLEFTIPDDWLVDIAGSSSNTVPLSETEIERRLLAFTDILRATHDPSRPLIFVFTDATRASPDQRLLEPIVRHIADDGFDITFLCAVGMHRPSTREEKIAKLGAWIVENFRVIDHDPAGVIRFGVVNGTLVEANPLLKDATIVGVGVVEPHQYAGYSGGVKTVVIGCGGPQTIGATHGPPYLDLPGTRLGAVDGNPFQAFVREAGAVIGQDWAVNVILDSDYRIIELAAGKPDDVHDTLVKRAREIYETPVPNAPYDVVIAGMGAPKHVNLYQASRGATYIGLSARPVIRRGGVIIVPAPIPEGGGEGEGERNFMQVMLRFGPTLELIEYLRENGCRPGEQRAFMIAQLRQRYRLIIVGAERIMPVLEADLDNAPDMNEALHMAVKLTRTESPKTLIVPHSVQTIPVPAQ
ncbi:MAG: lactate racemase domain-containing protein [Chloroflexi bacterium]|nr:lactate racemase domain-containing protein [Chloroflexota bacterium]